MGVSNAGTLRETETGTHREEILQEARSQRCTNARQVRALAQASTSAHPQTHSTLPTPVLSLARPRTVNSLSQSWAAAYERVGSVISCNSSISPHCWCLSSKLLKAQGSIISILLMEKPRPQTSLTTFSGFHGGVGRRLGAGRFYTT